MNGSRRVRVTLGCHQEDLGLPVPDAHTELLPDDRIIGEVVGNAPTFPNGLKRILCVHSPPVFRVRFSRERAAAWLEDELGLVWVLAVGIRKNDTPGEDFYSHVERLHDVGRLLPTEDDYLRDRVELGARLLKALPGEIAYLASHADGHPGTDFEAKLGGRIGVRICVERDDGLDAIWVAVACLDVHTQPVPVEVRNVIFALFQEALAPAEWEDTGSWRGGVPLRYYECCRYALKGT